MKERRSFNNEKSILYLIGTPIGNLKDITFRALETIKEVDFLYAEDTRITKKILDHYKIDKELLSYHKFNEDERLIEIRQNLENGFSVGFCSDAGMPSISDPGYGLVASLKDFYNVVVVPGPSASLTALVGSGLVVEPFTFVGFLEKKKTAKIKQIKEYQDLTHTLIFYETAKRINDSLMTLFEVLGKRKCIVARELTKIYETYYEFALGDNLDALTLKGEMVIIVEGKQLIMVADDIIIEALKFEVNNGLSVKDAVLKVSEKYNVNKNKVYQLALDNKL